MQLLRAGDCIIYGNREEELEMDLDKSTTSNYKFDYCLLKTLAGTDVSHFIQCIINSNPKFVDVEKDDYHLDSYSSAIGRGNPSYSTSYTSSKMLQNY